DPDEKMFSAKARACWDDRFFYVGFDVEDNSPMKNAGADPFLAFKTGDTVEFYLSTDPDANPKRTEPAKSDYHVLMTYLQDVNGIVYLYHPIGEGEPKYFSHPAGAWRIRMDEHGPIDGARI